MNNQLPAEHGLFEFAHNFTDREWATIQNAVAYADDPFGDVAHNLKLIVAKLVTIINFQAVALE